MDHLFDEENLKQIAERLKFKNETIAVAESVTSGLLQYAFANVKEASKFFQGGLTAYNVGQKYKHLNVEPIHAIAANCVSEKVALEMSKAVSQMYLSDWGVAVTGYCTRVSESNFKLYAFFAITKKNAVVKIARLTPETEDPQEIQLYYVNSILKEFSLLL